MLFSSFRMIQEEKESTELRAEQLESRVTSGSMEALNLTQLRKRASIPTSLTALSLASSSPPVSGRSTPKLSSRSAAQDLDRICSMTLVSKDKDVSYIQPRRPVGCSVAFYAFFSNFVTASIITCTGYGHII